MPTEYEAGQSRAISGAGQAQSTASPKPGTWDTELGLESPLLQRFHRLWLDKRRDDLLPPRSEFDPLEMKGFLGSVFLVATEPDGDDFRYTLIGGEITRHVGVDNTGRRVSEVFGTTGLELYRKIRDERRPIRVHGAVDWRQQEYKAYEALVLPLADDGRQVDRFIGIMVFALADGPTE